MRCGNGRLRLLRFAPLLLLTLPASAATQPTAAPLAPADPRAVPASVANAPIALLVDMSAGQTLFARRERDPFLPASMTKVMSILVAFDLIRAGKLREDTVISVRRETALAMAGQGTSLALQPYEHVTVRDLLHGLATVSANDAGVVLAQGTMGSEAEWTAAMNRRAKAIGMRASYFASTNGLPDGQFTQVTAADMVRLGETLITEYPDLYRRYFGHPFMVWNGQVLSSHNPFVQGMPGADGIKTGYTREAGYTFLGSVVRGGRRLLVVVGQVPTSAMRRAAARDLIEWGFAAWTSRPFLPAHAVVGTARVQDGDKRSVLLQVPRAYTLTLPVGAAGKPIARIVYQGPLRAPIQRGAKVAQLEVSIAGQPSYRLPLVAAQAVEQAGPIDRVWNGLLGLLE